MKFTGNDICDSFDCITYIDRYYCIKHSLTIQFKYYRNSPLIHERYFCSAACKNNWRSAYHAYATHAMPDESA